MKLFKNSKKQAKWGVSYSLYEGEELLEASINSIRETTDYINVVYSNTSWIGEKRNIDLLCFLSELKNKGLIDEIINFEPDLSKTPGENELKKRNIGLKKAKEANCDYFMTMDVDEFYIKEDIKKSQEYILQNNITNSYCGTINYCELPTKRMLQNTITSIQFFSKISKKSRLGINKNTIAIVDPTRMIKGLKNEKHFYIKYIRMHHMTFVRSNIETKIKNHPCSDNKDRFNRFLADENYIVVDNIFNIEV